MIITVGHKDIHSPHKMSNLTKEEFHISWSKCPDIQPRWGAPITPFFLPVLRFFLPSIFFAHIQQLLKSLRKWQEKSWAKCQDFFCLFWSKFFLPVSTLDRPRPGSLRVHSSRKSFSTCSRQVLPYLVDGVFDMPLIPPINHRQITVIVKKCDQNRIVWARLINSTFP